MGDPHEGKTYPLPINSQIVPQLAHSTIKGLVDAIVELVTNSDDSYRRLEEDNGNVRGEIDVHVIREKKNACRQLRVTDHAEGMDAKALQNAIEFAAPTSGFIQGRTVRGLFGRGLKEAIVALGRGKISTVKEGQENEVDIFVENGQPKYKWIKHQRSTISASGTTITIEILSPNIKCPTFNTLYRNLTRHFALRDILQNQHRVVSLCVEDVSVHRCNTRPLKFQLPEGDMKVNEELDIKGFGKAVIQIYESYDRLEFSSNDPSSLAGILIKTERSILDNRLFGFEIEPSAHYFFGWVDCPGIASTIRQENYGVLNPNRNGLDWRHPYCKDLRDNIERLLNPLIQKKKARLESQSPTLIREEYRKKMRDICRLLNKLTESELNELAESEINELPDWGYGEKDITTLVIRPVVGYSEPEKYRTFSVYVPESILAKSDLKPVVTIELIDVNGSVKLRSNRVKLLPHKKYKGLLTGSLEVIGSSYGDRAYVIANLDELEDIAEFKVQNPSHSKSHRTLSNTNQGLFREIAFDETPDPIQRVAFVNGTIKIFRQFPPIPRYLGPDGKGILDPQGSLMLAELVAEAFCKEVARKRIESGVPPIPGAEIDHFNNQVNQLMRKNLADIHDALVV